MNLIEKYLSKAKGELLKETMLEKYKQFICWLGNHDQTAEEIEKQNPELLKEIHKTIESMDSCFNKEDFQGFKDNMERVKRLYVDAVNTIKKEIN